MRAAHPARACLAAVLMVASCTKGAQPNCAQPLAGAHPEASSGTTSDIHPASFGDGHVACSGRELLNQGFSGTLDKYAEISYLGSVQAGAFAYSLYYYSRNERHGIHSVLMFENGCEYVGEYLVSSKPVSVSKKGILFHGPANIGNIIPFFGISPPARVVIDGEVTTFTR